ncbi:ankyrin repeat-containing domain protein [Fusarium avenaceum]|nr:ankyrin repeat-containing domain protein [Fusarium avenaceum]
MSLENLATELVEFIAGYLLADVHLNALCQTNRRFYYMFNQRLYDQDAHSFCRALSWGAWKGLFPCVRRSLDSGADVNIVNDYVVKNYADETPIFMAVRNEDFDTVHLLLSRGADVNRRNKTGDNLVYFAVSTGNIAMVRLILAQGVDPTCHDDGDVPPLLLAVRRGYLEIAETLLDQGVKIDDGDSWGETPLQVALTGGQHEILKLFLDRNFIRNDPTGDIGADALEVAIVRPDFRALKLLLEGGANPLARRWTGYNAIISATLSREEGMAIFMTEPLNDLSEIKDRVGKGLLWYAAKGRCERYTKYLLDRGVDPNTDTWQPLTGAMFGGSALVTEMLLDCGADVELKDEIGRSPLKVALEEGVESERQEVVRLLLSKGASLEKAELNDEQKVLVQSFSTCES